MVDIRVGEGLAVLDDIAVGSSERITLFVGVEGKTVLVFEYLVVSDEPGCTEQPTIIMAIRVCHKRLLIFIQQSPILLIVPYFYTIHVSHMEIIRISWKI